MSQLEPCAGVSIRKLVWVCVEMTRNRLVDRVHAQGHIRSRHHRWVLLTWNVSVRHESLCLFFLRLPLPSTSWALHKLPLVSKEHIKVGHVPLGWRWCPSTF